jgi:triosephosphate isomerase
MKRYPLLVAGNWKMHGLRASLSEIEAVKAGIGSSPAVDVWVFPPATLITAAAAVAEGSSLGIGGQDCRAEESGAFTGDISAAMLKDVGGRAVILGHSERRSLHGETSAAVRAKASSALKQGLRIIVCLGETRGEREAGLASAVCVRQLRESLPPESTPSNTVIAYEPVWAIGSGLSPTAQDIGDIHATLRAELHKRGQTETGWRILYGGSVTPANAAEIFESPEADGVLVGGASLNAASFLAIIAAAHDAQMRRASER